MNSPKLSSLQVIEPYLRSISGNDGCVKLSKCLKVDIVLVVLVADRSSEINVMVLEHSGKSSAVELVGKVAEPASPLDQW